MNINELFSASRTAMNLTQETLAAGVNVSQTAIARMEKPPTLISNDRLMGIVPALNINPRFIEDPSCNPFFSASLIHYCINQPFTRDSVLLRVLLSYNSKLEMLVLLERQKNGKRSGEKTVAALVIRDQDSNIFLFTPQAEWGSITISEVIKEWSKYLQHIDKKKSLLMLAEVAMTASLAKTISAEKLSIPYVRSLFKNKQSGMKTLALHDETTGLSIASHSPTQPSAREMYLIQFIRSLDVRPEELIGFIKHWRPKR